MASILGKLKGWTLKNLTLLSFGIRTIFYTIVILGLLFLYQYSGVTGSHFIYNEF